MYIVLGLNVQTDNYKNDQPPIFIRVKRLRKVMSLNDITPKLNQRER